MPTIYTGIVHILPYCEGIWSGMRRPQILAVIFRGGKGKNDDKEASPNRC